MTLFLHSAIIGDPTLYGWTMTAVLAVAALLCAAALARSKSWRERAFWLVSTTLAVALAVNKQLDLQTPLRNAAKRATDTFGLTDHNDELQIVGVVVLAAIAAAAASILFVVVRTMLFRFRVAAIGFALLLGFVLVRMASIEHALPANDFTLGVARTMEMTGSILLIWGALRRKKTSTGD